MENKKHIEIEKMLFGDYRVQVWDENLNSCLDREYFCRGYISACMTALEIKESLFKGLKIFYRDGSKLVEYKYKFKDAKEIVPDGNVHVGQTGEAKTL